MPPLSFEEIQRKSQERLRGLRGTRPAVLTGSRPAEEPEELSLVQQAGDILAAPLRGVEGAAQDIYGLADTLALDALPDYQERLFGKSRTFAGGLVEGVFNFGAGFVGAGFVPLGFVGKLGKLAPIAKAAIKGAIADFTVFDGHEERLSNLIQAFPSLQNPVNEFLAASKDDSELEGRFKNSLEGLGLGLVTDLALTSFKALRATRLARAAGKTPEEIERAVDRAVPPRELEAAVNKAAGGEPAPAPLEGQIGDPARPEAADAVKLVQETPPIPPVQADPIDILHTMDVPEAQARQLMDLARSRAAEPRLGLNVVPSKLSEIDRLALGIQSTDLNLSRYQGPEGSLQLLRAMEQLVEPLKGLGDASRRTLNQQENDVLTSFADILGDGNLHRVLVFLQKDVSDLPGLMHRLPAYKIALQAHADYAFRLADKAFGVAGTDKDILLAVQSFQTQAELELGVKTLLGETARGLGSNRLPVPFIADLFDKEAVEAALHERGGRARALDLIAKYRTLYKSETDAAARTAKVADFARGVYGRRAFGVLNEYWYNSLLGRPTTVVVNGFSNALTTVYRPLELIAGGALTGRTGVIADGVREITNLIGSAGDAWRATAAALRGDGHLLDPKAVFSDVHDISRRAISPEALGVGPDTVHGQALTWLGRLVRMPSTVLTATDQFFQNLNYRALARSELTKEALMNPAIGPAGASAFVHEQMDRLIFKGQAYGTAQLYHQGVEEAVRGGLRSKVQIDEAARAFVTKQLSQPEHARLSALGQLALQRAQEVTFTTPLAPGTVAYRVQEAVLNHWYLRLIMPFVRTPVNIINFAAQRNVGAVSGVVQLLAAKRFPAVAASLEHSRNSLVRDMLSHDSRRKADAIGRMSLGLGTTAYILTKAGESDPDGLPVITGRGPTDKEQRQILEESGWQPYSVRVGNKYVSYGRIDPFASILGTAADLVNFVKYAAPEDQGAVEDLAYGTAVSLVNNLVNKTYLSGLANFLDMLHDPQNRFPVWANTLGASFVPGEFAATVSVDDPVLRDVRSMLDAASARIPGLSNNLPPLRNVLGEPVRRAQSLGSGISSVANAFVPVLYREVSDDVINKELVRLRHGFTPPRRQRGNLDLTTVVGSNGQNAYDRWLELHGEVEIGGRTLRQALRRTITGANYQRIGPDSSEGVDSPRIRIVQGLIEDYRQAAYRKLLKEFPVIAGADRRRLDIRSARLRGQPAPPPLLQALRGQ